MNILRLRQPFFYFLDLIGNRCDTIEYNSSGMTTEFDIIQTINSMDGGIKHGRK